jgi:hypothetical protein
MFNDLLSRLNSGESGSMEKGADELCGTTFVPIAVAITAQDSVARFVPVSHCLARRLEPRPVLVIRHYGQQIAVLTDWAGFDLVDNL